MEMANQLNKIVTYTLEMATKDGKTFPALAINRATVFINAPGEFATVEEVARWVVNGKAPANVDMDITREVRKITSARIGGTVLFGGWRLENWFKALVDNGIDITIEEEQGGKVRIKYIDQLGDERVAVVNTRKVEG